MPRPIGIQAGHNSGSFVTSTDRYVPYSIRVVEWNHDRYPVARMTTTAESCLCVNERNSEPREGENGSLGLDGGSW
jgi:hypothetical protein